MCLTVAVCRSSLALVATDTRWCFCEPNGGTVIRDLGGKLRPTRSGWVVGTGNVPLVPLVLDALTDDGSSEGAPPQTAADLRRQVRELYALHAPAIVANMSAENENAPVQTVFQAVVRRPGGVSIHAMSACGTVLANERDADGATGGGLFVTWPCPATPEMEAARAACHDAIAAATTLGTVFRAVAALFATTAALSDRMSDHVQFGISFDGRRGLLAGRAAAFATRTDAELESAVQGPPLALILQIGGVQRRVLVKG